MPNTALRDFWKGLLLQGKWPSADAEALRDALLETHPVVPVLIPTAYRVEDRGPQWPVNHGRGSGRYVVVREEPKLVKQQAAQCSDAAEAARIALLLNGGAK